MYSVLAIADQLLKIAKKQGKALTPLQLMKLVYVAHGWSLGLNRGDLFGERIEAWKYGPVIPDLYHVTKRFGRNPIPLDLVDENVNSVNDETDDFLSSVFEQYGNLSGEQLSQLTHQSGTPWEAVYNSGAYNGEITDDLIRNHYMRLFNDRNISTAAS